QLDPNKGERPDRAEPSRQPCAPLPALQPEDQVLRQLPDVPDLVHDRRFREGARRLLAQGKTPRELVLAVRAAVGDPEECGGLSFIADRFPRWARKAQEKERQQRQSRERAGEQMKRWEQERNEAKERARIR